MFKSEIEERQLNTIVCACNHQDPRSCKKGVWREFLALDDAFSWVMVGKKEEKKGEGERVLYCLDEVSDCMRKQDQVEVERSRKSLSKAGNTGNCFFNDSADYVCFIFLGCSFIDGLLTFFLDGGVKILRFGMLE